MSQKMNPELAISLQNITKSYRLYDKPIDRLKESLNPFKKTYHQEFFALKNINLDIKKGEVLGIVGINGAGKSTLLKIIAGVVTPSGGNLQVNGRVNAILELGSALKPEMTGIENIKLNLKINGVTKNTQQLLDEIVDFADIGEHINQPVKSYSSGMTARLGFAIATSTDPDILIVDEVLAVGDVLFQRKCYAKIEQLFKDGKTVIFVSHSAQSVIEFCTRAVLLYDREIILDDTPKKVTDYYQRLVFSKDKLELMPKAKERDHYLDELKIEPQVINKNILKIKNIVIRNKKDKVVNVLQSFDSYKLSAKIFFMIDLHEVTFGVQVFTNTGLLINGSNSRELNSKTYNVRANDQYNIEMSFDCLLTNGYYSIGFMFYDKDKLNTVVIKDAYVFEVKRESGLQRGYALLNNQIEIKIANS